jgi:preprotein translocase subunit YajC
MVLSKATLQLITTNYTINSIPFHSILTSFFVIIEYLLEYLLRMQRRQRQRHRQRQRQQATVYKHKKLKKLNN